MSLEKIGIRRTCLFRYFRKVNWSYQQTWWLLLTMRYTYFALCDCCFCVHFPFPFLLDGCFIWLQRLVSISWPQGLLPKVVEWWRCQHRCEWEREWRRRSCHCFNFVSIFCLFLSFSLRNVRLLRNSFCQTGVQYISRIWHGLWYL